MSEPSCSPRAPGVVPDERGGIVYDQTDRAEGADRVMQLAPSIA